MMLVESPQFCEPPLVNCGFQVRSKPRPVQRELPDRRRLEAPVVERRAATAESPRRLPDPGWWLEQVYGLCAKGRIDPAIRLVLDEVDELLSEGNATRCDEILAAADVGRMPVEVMLAFLMGTFRAKSAESMSRRAGFFARVEQRLRTEVPERADRLLRGLR